MLGYSIGALIGLHLATLHPNMVRVLLAHEPPMSRVVRDENREAGLDKVQRIAESDVIAAVREMEQLIGGTAEREPGASPASQVGDLASNLRMFFKYDFPAVRSSRLDANDVVNAAKAVRIIAAAGRLSHGGWENRCARVLAERLGHSLVELPGGTTH